MRWDALDFPNTVAALRQKREQSSVTLELAASLLLHFARRRDSALTWTVAYHGCIFCDADSRDYFAGFARAGNNV